MSDIAQIALRLRGEHAATRPPRSLGPNQELSDAAIVSPFIGQVPGPPAWMIGVELVPNGWMQAGHRPALAGKPRPFKQVQDGADAALRTSRSYQLPGLLPVLLEEAPGTFFSQARSDIFFAQATEELVMVELSLEECGQVTGGGAMSTGQSAEGGEMQFPQQSADGGEMDFPKRPADGGIAVS